MKKKFRLLFAVALLAVSMWFFIWPSFGHYFMFVIPLPGTSEIKAVRVEKNAQGKWDAYVDYFFTGRPDRSRIQLALHADLSPAPQNFNEGQSFITAIRGTHTVKLAILKPQFEQNVTTNIVEARLTHAENGSVLSSARVDFKIDWPDRETYHLNRKLDTQPRDVSFKDALTLIERGDSRALVESRAILEGLVRRDPMFAPGIEQLTRIATLASWSPQGISKIANWQDMNDVVNGLRNAKAYEELNFLAHNLIESKALNDAGFTKLRQFHHALNGDYFNIGELSEKWLKDVESGKDDVESAWEKKVPKSYLPRITYAKGLMRVAWQIRGGGYANSVSEENMQRFHSLAQRSVAVLMKCKEICDSDPEWYATTIETMHLAGMDRHDFAPFFVEGFTKFPWYQAIYVAMSVTYAPKWGGSVEEVESFARELAKRFPVVEQDLVYGRLYEELYGYGNIFKSIDAKSSAMDCSRSIKGFDAIVKKWPSNYNANVAARVAKRCADKAATRRFLAKVGSNADLTVWTAADFSNTVAWASSR